MDKYRTDYEVLSRNADPNGRLSIQALALMLLDAADRHAAQWRLSLGQLAETNQTWVLSRFHVRLARQPSWTETITIDTWPAGTMRLLALRDFRILADGSDVGTATTFWLMIDRTSRRPVKLPEFIHEFELPAEGPLIRARADWPLPSNTAREIEMEIAWNHLDLNRHASAPSYLSWLLTPIPAETAANSGLVELDIVFKSEGFLGERLNVRVSKINSAKGVEEFCHSVSRMGDGQLLASARTLWRP